jgi:DNA-binding MarR family transcriptional regulator
MSEVLTPHAVPTVEAVQRTPDEARLVALLLSISKSTRALVGLKLGELGFHNGQDELLFALDEADPVSVTKLAEELSVRPSTVDRLIASGTAERTLDVRDARRTMVRITPAGLDARARLQEMRAKLESELVAGLAENGQDVAAAMLDLSGNLKARLSRLR